jgi:hypothetical protein
MYTITLRASGQCPEVMTFGSKKAPETSSLSCAATFDVVEQSLGMTMIAQTQRVVLLSDGF